MNELDKAFDELDEEWNGNFNMMPIASKLHYRTLMAEAFRTKTETFHAIRNLCKLDLYFLCHSILGFEDTIQPVHRPFSDHIESNPTKSINMMPRGYFKSSVGTIGRATQLLLNDPNERILIANATATLSEKFVRKIGSFFLSNHQIKKFFPERIPTNIRKVKWCDNAIELPRPQSYPEASVEAIGVGGTVVGRHYTTIFFDDLVNEDHLTSINQMDKVIEWYKLAYGSLGVKGHFNAIHNATRWSYYDVISWVIDNQPEFSIFRLSCYNDERQSTFPSVYSTEDLKELEIIKGPTTFAAQFLNDPIPNGTQVFRKEWIQFYDKLPDIPMRTYMMVDPAISEGDTACQRAIIVVSVDEDFNWYIRDYSVGFWTQWHPTETSLVGEVFRLYNHYQPWFVGIEDVGYQKALQFLIKREMPTKGIHFNITSIKPDRRQTKDMRIETLSHPFGANKVFMKPWMTELQKQLLGYPAFRYKDLIDALSYMMQYAWPTSRTIELTRTKENSLADIRRRIEESRHSSILQFKEPTRVVGYA